MLQRIHRFLFLDLLGTLLSVLLLKVKIVGREHIPEVGQEPILLIANHFSWVEAPLIVYYILRETRFLASTELQDTWFLRQCFKAGRGIPVWRGSADRKALKTSLDLLKTNGVVGIFPEGGIDPDIRDRVNQGEQIHERAEHASRLSGALIAARPGAAYLAVTSGARVLPVAVKGGENFQGNLGFPWKRTLIEIEVGPMFGPLEIDPKVRGAAKRKLLDEQGDVMMHHLAQLFPNDKRGPYADRAAA